MFDSTEPFSLCTDNQRVSCHAKSSLAQRASQLECTALEAPADVTKEVERLASSEVAFTAEQLAACSPNGRQILRSFFQRCHQLDDGPRHQLARRLAAEFLRKTSYRLSSPVMDGPMAEVFLASLYRDLEKLARHGR